MKVHLLLFLLVSSLIACTSNTENQDNTSFKVGLVLDRGGKDDKSFNTAAYTGATKAKQELDIQLKDVESPDDAAFEPAMRTFAEREFPLVIAIGFSQKDALEKVAPQFPKTKFTLVDAVVTGDNVQSLMFSEHEGSYLVGYLSGLATKTNVVGFIGGMDIALIRRFHMGFEAGVKAANPKAKILVNYVGITGEAWANPNRGKELARGQYGRKADIIYAAAGATNLGIFDAAEEKGLYAIGVDSNQNGVKPGHILTSMLKRVDVAVFEAIKDAKNGQWKAGTRYFGLADKGIDIAIDENNEKLIAPYKEKIEKVKQDIISGKIQVPDYYKLRK